MKLLHRNRRSKRGSSLPMVMAIGAALVVWVMALMPLMATSGTTAAQTKALEANYLSSKSSIEFVKGELTEMVKTDLPRSFVTYISGETNGIETYSSERKRDNNIINPDYIPYVTYDTTDPFDDTKDINDVPNMDESGALVTAICSVVRNGYSYDIIITTYNNGVKGMVYTATYTAGGTIKFYPEAYKQFEALPLSDFVLVDGKYGDKVVWDSNLIPNAGESASITYTSSNYLNFSKLTETLLPEQVPGTSTDDYANAGEYPAVFKATADAYKLPDADSESGYDEDVDFSKPLTDPVPEAWILPTVEDFTVSLPTSSSVKISLTGQLSSYNLKANDILLYANGEALSVTAQDEKSATFSLPGGTGAYRLTLDFAGTDVTSDPSVLSATGLELILPTSGIVVSNAVTCNINEAPKISSSIVSKEYKNGTLKVTLQSISENDIRYGYSTSVADDKDDIEWQESNTFSIPNVKGGSVYYFYCRRIGRIDNQTVTEPSPIVYVGYVAPFAVSTSLENGSTYMVFSKASEITPPAEGETLQGDTYYAMSGNPSNETVGVKALAVSQGMLDSGIFTDDFINEVGANLKWTYKKDAFCQFVLRDGETNYHLYASNGLKLKRENDIGRLDTSNDFNIGSNANSIYKSTGTRGQVTILESGVSMTSDAPNLYFVKIPSIGNPKSFKVYDKDQIGIDVSYGSYSIKKLASDLEDKLGMDHSSNNNTLKYNGKKVDLYLNGDKVSLSNEAALNSGVYLVHAVIGDVWGIPIATLSISPSEFELSGTPSAKVTTPYQIDVDYNKWASNGGAKYYGYYPLPEEAGASAVAGTLSIADYKWSKDEKIENLPLGWYLCAVMQCNSINYVCTNDIPLAVTTYTNAEEDNKDIKSAVIEHPYAELNATVDTTSLFIYTTSDDGTITWFRLPKYSVDKTAYTGADDRMVLRPGRATIYYGTNTGTEENPVYSWTSDFPGWVEGEADTVNTDAIGVTIANSNFETTPIIIYSPVSIGSINGHSDSVISGSALYFMGDTFKDASGVPYSINTYGNTVTVTADLLVLRHGIATATDASGNNMGAVRVYSYSGKDTLLFAVNDFGPFYAKNFYRIPEGTNLATVNTEDATAWNIGNSIGGGLSEGVRNLFLADKFPTMNADIAYADNSQLAAIVSGEAIGWTKNGALSGKDLNTTNGDYAVCAFVTSITGNTECAANRIFIGTDSQTGNVLSVPYKLSLTARYLSLDADTIEKVNSSSFYVYALSEEDNWFESWLEGILDVNYNSNTLQVDYERDTHFVLPDVISMDRNIYRYKSGTNLFDDPTNCESELMVTYTVDEINDQMSGSITMTEIQERYVRIQKGSETVLDVRGRKVSGLLGLYFPADLWIYSNYIDFDGITQIYLHDGYTGDSSLVLNPQEKGYNDEEYLGLFKDASSDSYHGVMLRFCDSSNPSANGEVNVTFGSGRNIKSYDIPYGFYFIEMSDDESNLGILDIAKKISEDEANPGRDENGNIVYKYRVDQAWLIENGLSVDNVFIDSGIEGGVGGTTPNTGFSGGSMQ